MLDVMARADGAGVGPETCARERMTYDSPAKKEGNQRLGREGIYEPMTYVWLQYSSRRRLELPITSAFRASRNPDGRRTQIIPIVLPFSITLRFISVFVILILPTCSTACELSRPTSVVLTIMLYSVSETCEDKL
jgi:hypothetical protein